MAKLNVFGNLEGLKKGSLKEVLDKTLKSLKIYKEDSINLIFVSEKKIQDLNARYRGINEPTDVLSFSYDEIGSKGEIVVCLDRIKKDSKKDDVSLEEGFTKVFIHGILHLYGYDHENEKDKAKMKKKEEEIFQEIR